MRAVTLALIGLFACGELAFAADVPAFRHDSRVDPTLGALLESSSRAGAVSSVEIGPGFALSLPANGPMDETQSSAVTAAVGPTTWVELILEGNMDRTSVEALGVVVGTQADGVMTARAPLALVPALLGVPGLKGVRIANRLEPASLNSSAPEINANTLWGQNASTPPGYSGLTGRNVLIGLIETGFDLQHADFRRPSNGKTRVRFAWDQTRSAGTHPAGFSYGANYDSAQIDAGLASSISDLNGHGTHVAGIAASNGKATGMSQPAYQYIGIAPEADLIVVQSLLTESQIIDAVKYIFDRATALGLPAVINLSVSVTTGDRNGQSALDKAISALTGPRKLISAAVGNYGDKSSHSRINLGSAQTSAITFTVPTYTAVLSSVNIEEVRIECWHDSTAQFKVKLRSPNGYETPWIESGVAAVSQTLPDGYTYISNDLVTSGKGGRGIYAILQHGDDSLPHPASGTWTLTVTRTGGSQGVADFWLSKWSLNTLVAPTFSSFLDSSYTITSPATADSAIATGSYTYKTTWLNGNNQNSFYPSAPPTQALVPYSGRGPRRGDNATRPDVIAPGFMVPASMSAAAAPYVSVTYKTPDQQHSMKHGTSMAAAHTTGSLALLLQQTPNLTPSAARLEIRRRVRTDSYTLGVPNSRVGYGKLDLTASGGQVGVADDLALERLAFVAPWPSPSRDAVHFRFDVSSQDLSAAGAGVSVTIYNVAGRAIATLHGAATVGTQQLVWDGRSARGTVTEAGVYFARLSVGSTTAVRKFLRLEP